MNDADTVVNPGGQQQQQQQQQQQEPVVWVSQS